MSYTQEVKERAYKIDPQAWASYSGAPKKIKQYWDGLRTGALKQAQRESDAAAAGLEDEGGRKDGDRCFWLNCSNRIRCQEHGSCVAEAQAGGAAWPTNPGPEHSPEYQRGWDDCLARVWKVLGEKFTQPVKS